MAKSLFNVKNAYTVLNWLASHFFILAVACARVVKLVRNSSGYSFILFVPNDWSQGLAKPINEIPRIFY
jgi:hypothetical protein